MIKYLKIKKKYYLKLFHYIENNHFYHIKKFYVIYVKVINVKFLNRYDQSNLIQIRKFKK